MERLSYLAQRLLVGKEGSPAGYRRKCHDFMIALFDWMGLSAMIQHGQ